MVREELLAGAIDLHVHAAPDVVERAQGAWEVAEAAKAAGMAGIGLKDHVTSTVGRCAVLNARYAGEVRFFSSLVLNPTVGGLNVQAVEAAVKAGCDVVYFPTYGARHQIEVQGAGAMPFPVGERFEGDSPSGREREVWAILGLVAEYDAVLATGHLAPEESVELLEMARESGVERCVVTHASEPVPGMPVEVQRRCVELGAVIEHCLMACTACCSPPVAVGEIARQIREVGVEHVVVSSDFGQVANGAAVEAFGGNLEELMGCGFSMEEMRRMIVENPGRVVEGRG